MVGNSFPESPQSSARKRPASAATPPSASSFPESVFGESDAEGDKPQPKPNGKKPAKAKSSKKEKPKKSKKHPVKKRPAAAPATKKKPAAAALPPPPPSDEPTEDGASKGSDEAQESGEEEDGDDSGDPADGDGDGAGPSLELTEKSVDPLLYAGHVLSHANKGALAAVLRRGPIKAASFCTGVGTDAICFEALADVWNELYKSSTCATFKVEHVFAVESDAKKRQNLLKGKYEYTHVFEKAEHVAGGRAWCYKTETLVNTYELDVDMLCAGYPCKTVSKLNAAGKHAAFDDPATKTGSAQQALMQYCRQRLPAAVMFENVIGVVHRRQGDQGKRRPIEQQNGTMASLGYSGAWAQVNSKHYGTPQSRPRIYMWYLQDGDASRIPGTMESFRTKPLAAEDILERDMPAGPPALCQSRSRGHLTTKCTEQLRVVCKKHGLKVSEVRARAQEIPALPRRAACIVAMEAMKMEGLNAQGPYLIQHNQMPVRSDNVKPRMRFLAPCVTPAGQYWVMPRGTPLTLQERALLQGFTKKELQTYMGGVCRKTIEDLLGNAFTTTVCTSALVSLLTHWARQ